MTPPLGRPRSPRGACWELRPHPVTSPGPDARRVPALSGRSGEFQRAGPEHPIRNITASSWDERPCQTHGPPAKQACPLPGATRRAVPWLGPASALWECRGHVHGHSDSGQAVLASGR